MSVELYNKEEEDLLFKKGRVMEVLLNHEHPKEQMLILETIDGTRVYIPYEEITIHQPKTDLTDYVGKLFNFHIKEIIDDRIIGSCKLYQEAQREKLLKTVAENPETIFTAYVVKEKKYGVYLNIKGVSIFLENYQYSKKPIRACDELKVGDQINVQIIESFGKKICAKSIYSDEKPYILNFNDFKPGQVVLGLVRTMKDQHLFVCIAPGLDAIAPYSSYFDVEEGDLVCLKIKQVREDRRIRGKVVRNLTKAN